ncbi:MAG: NAD(P)H-dependent glycerol-3-phosphate dehydrogenase [candidate division Zixibacteria bacterium]|nr:NAD(P)H-dependent glycerol-3-phosphate dehydrogenase [candidate division Zixibacteria bacterium]
MAEKLNITVLGGGSWGIAFAVHLLKCGHNLRLWEFNPDDARMLKTRREHPDKLPGIGIPEGIYITDNLFNTIDGSNILCLVVPSHTVREVCGKLKKAVKHAPIIVNLAKGLEFPSLKRMSEVVFEIMGMDFENRVMTLSGPSHAEEVAREIPTTVTLAGDEIENLEFVQEAFNSTDFRVYTNLDLLGVELAGSLKNIIAIAAGICDGLGFGDNTKGALLTRGLTEITRLGMAMGAQQETFAGLSGIGDLITTCLSRHSRNRLVGEKMGKGMKLDEILRDMKMVAEGVRTTRAAVELADKYHVDMPITMEMYNILFEDKSPLEAVSSLMSRQPKPEVRHG